MTQSIDTGHHTGHVKTRTKPRRNPATVCARGVIRAYQLVISPLFAPSCRYAPSCSRYALDAIGRFGVIRGGWLALVRLAGCHPWGGQGYDPVPPAPVDQDDPVGQDEMAGR